MTSTSVEQVIVRPATEADLPGIRDVGVTTWPTTYGFAGEEYIRHGLARWWSIDALAESLRNTETVVAVEEDGTIVGVGNLDLRRTPPVIWKLYVRPERHGHGVGTALLTALVQRTSGEPIRLEYLAGNEPAAAFYTARGFHQIGRQAAPQPGWPDTIWTERSPTNDLAPDVGPQRDGTG